jgi:hypothetical protein
VPALIALLFALSLTACEGLERVKLVDRVPDTDVAKECPPEPDKPTGKISDNTLAEWMAEVIGVSRVCRGIHTGLLDWALKRKPSK